jgi:hypothetical protein
MIETSSAIKGPSLLSPRTADYVAALIREGDSFDYCEWLEQVREKEARAKECPQTVFRRNTPEEIGDVLGTFAGRKPSPHLRLFNKHAFGSIRMTRLRRKTLHSSSGTRIRWRLERISSAWDDFQASRTRDAVYGYLDAVFAIVEHYRVRRRTKRLLRRAAKFSGLPVENNADPFTVVIRCTCADRADSKTISKWARALRYIAHCNVPRTRLKMFMKKAGGVNACADLYARYVGRSGR